MFLSRLKLSLNFSSYSVTNTEHVHFFNMQATPYIVLGVAIAVEVCLIIGSCIEEKNAYPIILLIPSIFCLLSQFGVDSVSGDDSEPGCVTVDAWNFFLGFGVIAALSTPVLLFRSSHIGYLSLGLMLGGAVLQVIGYYIYTCILRRNDDFYQF